MSVTGPQSIRISTKVNAPPGGFTSISFGGPTTPASTPTMREPQATTPDHDATLQKALNVKTAVAPVASGFNLEQMKLKMIHRIMNADEATLNLVLASFPKQQKKPVGTASDFTIGEVSDDDVRKLEVMYRNSESGLAAIKKALKAHGVHGVISSAKQFRSKNQEDNKVAFVEFNRIMSDLGISEGEKMGLFRFFDEDCSGYVSFDKFISGIHDDLTPSQKNVITSGFKALDKSGDGKVTVDDIRMKLDTSRHPDVILGTKTSGDVLAEILNGFEKAGGDGIVTYEDFTSYYKGVATCTEDEQYFELLVRNAWHVTGGDGWLDSTTTRKVLVLLEDGTQLVKPLTEAEATVDTVKAKLQAEGLAVRKVAIYTSFAYEPPKTDSAFTSPGTPREPSTPGTPGSVGTPRGTAKRHLQSSIQF